MSMLSAQCDELRAMAESVGLAMPQAATLMMEAADTIDRLDAENAKLRELVRLIYHHDRTPTIGELEAWHADGDEIEQRMRELGVVV